MIKNKAIGIKMIELEDKKIGKGKGSIALQIHNGGGIKVRWKNIKIEDKIISDSCEALLGAIYLDKGLNIVEKVILKLWNSHIEKSFITQIDAKTKL